MSVLCEPFVSNPFGDVSIQAIIGNETLQRFRAFGWDANSLQALFRSFAGRRSFFKWVTASRATRHCMPRYIALFDDRPFRLPRSSNPSLGEVETSPGPGSAEARRSRPPPNATPRYTAIQRLQGMAAPQRAAANQLDPGVDDVPKRSPSRTPSRRCPR